MFQETEIKSRTCNSETKEPQVDSLKIPISALSYADIDQLVACTSRFESIVCRGVELRTGSIIWYILRKPKRFKRPQPRIHVDVYSGKDRLFTKSWADAGPRDGSQPCMAVSMETHQYPTTEQCHKLLRLTKNAHARRMEIDLETADLLNRFIVETRWISEVHCEPLGLKSFIAFESGDKSCGKLAEAEIAATTFRTLDAYLKNSKLIWIETMSALMTKEWLSDSDAETESPLLPFQIQSVEFEAPASKQKVEVWGDDEAEAEMAAQRAERFTALLE